MCEHRQLARRLRDTVSLLRFLEVRLAFVVLARSGPLSSASFAGAFAANAPAQLDHLIMIFRPHESNGGIFATSRSRSAISRRIARRSLNRSDDSEVALSCMLNSSTFLFNSRIVWRQD
jgi:hypothetical protein